LVSTAYRHSVSYQVLTARQLTFSYPTGIAFI